MYLLDTNTVSMAARFPDGPVMRKMLDIGVDHLFINLIVGCEINFGMQKNNAFRLLGVVSRLMDSLNMSPLTDDIVAHYSGVGVDLERSGVSMGAMDLIIAAHALSLDAIVVSDDRAFEQVPRLKLENWAR